MMENGQLAAEVERLERLLASGPRSEPSPALRERVIRGAVREVRRQRVLLLAWASAATVAATVVLSLAFGYLFLASVVGNRVALSPASNGPFSRMPAVGAPRRPVMIGNQPIRLSVTAGAPIALPVAEVARRIRLLSPELSPEEAMRQAVLLQIGDMTGSRSVLADQLSKLRVDPPPRDEHADSRGPEESKK